MVYQNCRHFFEKRQFFLYLIVGAINTAFGYFIFAALVFFGLHYTLAVLLATFVGVLFNFKTMGCIVFRNSENKLIFRFFGVYIIQYFANISLIKFFLFLSLNVYIAGAISTMFCAALSYTLNKYFVFNKGGICLN